MICCHGNISYYVLPAPVLINDPVIGIAFNSVLQHNHSLTIVVIPKDTRLVNHHDNERGKPPYVRQSTK